MDALRGDRGCWQEGGGPEVGDRERELTFPSITLSTQQGSSTLCPHRLYPSPGGMNHPEGEKGKRRLRNVASPTSQAGKGQAWNLHSGLPGSVRQPLSIVCWRVKQSSGKDISGGRDWICVQSEKEPEERKG